MMVERVILAVTRDIARQGWGYDFRLFTDDAVPPHRHAALVGMIEVARDAV